MIIRCVSIAGAILWGVLPKQKRYFCPSEKFQSQGRFFGGCCLWSKLEVNDKVAVSIAGAILWGVLLSGDHIPKKIAVVSIAGAILWGVLHRGRSSSCHRPGCFNRRGDSLGGAADFSPPFIAICHSFNRRGDSLGGAASLSSPRVQPISGFNRRGDSLGGAALVDLLHR